MPAELHLQILGPLRVWHDDVELDPGPRQQAYLLAVLLAQAGRPVSASQLIDLIWEDDAPPSALNILQKYVGALRRLLEPGLLPRSSGSHLLSHGNGYLFAAGRGTSDLDTFRELVTAAEACVTEGWSDVALDCYLQALGLWQGHSGEGLNHRATAVPIFLSLDEEFFDCCVAATALAVAQGRPERVVLPLQLAARMAPLNETVQASLVTALGAAGRQAEALSAFETVRVRLGEELGIDPGPVLLSAHSDTLRRFLTPARPPQLPSAEEPAGPPEESSMTLRAIPSVTGGAARLFLVEEDPVERRRLHEDLGVDGKRCGVLVLWDRPSAETNTPWERAVRAVLDRLANEPAQLSDISIDVVGHDMTPGAGLVLHDSYRQDRARRTARASHSSVGPRRPAPIP